MFYFKVLQHEKAKSRYLPKPLTFSPLIFYLFEAIHDFNPEERGVGKLRSLIISYVMLFVKIDVFLPSEGWGWGCQK